MAAAVAASMALAAAVRYGPGNCISLDRSSAGSCVLTTECNGNDIDHFEFAFDCESLKDGSIVRHSYGRGGFDADEEFDSGIKCDTCSAPTEVLPQAPQKPPAVQQLIGHGAKKISSATAGMQSSGVSQEAQQAAGTTSHPAFTTTTLPKVALYGPKGCVSTYRSPEGHCIMQTKCQEADIKNYSFGFVCVDRLGAPVKHIFGVGSFDPVESFDTLVVCHECFGLEDIPTTIAMNSQVIALQSEVQSLEHMLVNISHEVERLDRVAFAAPPQPAPAAPNPVNAASAVNAASTENPQNTVSPPSGLASNPSGVVQGALLRRRVIKRTPLPARRLADVHPRQRATPPPTQQHLRGATGNSELPPASLAEGQGTVERLDGGDAYAQDAEAEQGNDEQDQDQDGQFDGGDPDAANIMPDLDDGSQEDTQEEDGGDSFQE